MTSLETMMAGNTFFVSEGLEEALFEKIYKKRTKVTIGQSEGYFISFDSKGRKLSFEINTNNPFDVVGDRAVEATIEFEDGASRKIPYTSFVYKIEQTEDRYIITIEDNVNE